MDKVIIKGVTCFGKWDLMEGGCFVAGELVSLLKS